MINVIDILYGVRDMADSAAQPLRAEISRAQAALDRLEAMAADAEAVAELAAASDRFPEWNFATPATPDEACKHESWETFRDGKRCADCRAWNCPECGAWMNQEGIIHEC